MNRRTLVFITLAVVLAAVFIRLGFWQLSRLSERRARNAGIAARMAATPMPFEMLRDTTSFRRAILFGTPDYSREVVYAGRSRDGSPGVYLLTPVRMSPDEPVAIVIRGWVYSPDAATVDLSRWRENRIQFSGYVSALPHQPSTLPVNRTVRSLDRKSLQGLFPYPIAPLYLVAQDSAGANAPVRLAAPRLDDGPHLSYAIQWFSFAAIALVGGFVVARRPQSGGDTQG